MMDNCCAPQWADFTSSPQLPSDKYFDLEHKVHEPKVHLKSTKFNVPLTRKGRSVNELPVCDTKSRNDTSAVKNKRVEIMYFIPNDNEKEVVKDTANDNVLYKTMTNLTLDENIHKGQDKWNMSARKTKSSMSRNIRRSANVLETKNRLLDNISLCDTKLQYKTDGKDVQTNLTEDKTELTMKLEIDDYPRNNVINIAKKRLSYKILTQQRRQSNKFKGKRYLSGKSQPKVLTCQYRRHSMIKHRRRCNQFVSLAEAVSKYQNGTPERFRTISTKKLQAGPLMRIKQIPLKLTFPVSPVLRCTQRTKQVTVLSQEQRTVLELQEMKKNQIKANPVPTNILKGPSVLKTVPKKPPTVTEEFRLTKPKKTCQSAMPPLSPRHTSGDKKQDCKRSASMHLPTRTSNVAIKKHNNSCTKPPVDNNMKSTTRTVPFSFDTRIKESQINREKKLKNLQTQETNKVKAEFHARPAPDFSKTINLTKEHNVKRLLVSCPFSFEKRDKSLAKKKEELVKQMKEEDKKARVFHANPIPSFKPVMVHGLSKENLRNKEKGADNVKKVATKQARSFIDQENKQPNIIAKSTTITDGKKEIRRYLKNDLKEKQSLTITEVTGSKNGKSRTGEKKILKPKIASVELITDKKAKECHQFDENVKQKEQKDEVKGQEEKKSELVEEKIERSESRKLTEIKARPVPACKPLVLPKSTKLQTSFQNPAWANKTKPKCAP